MSGLIVLGIIIVCLGYTAYTKLMPPVPPIRDYNRYNREIIHMSPKERQRALRAGRWS